MAIHHEMIHNWCLALPGAEATTPFGPDPIAYKVGGKMFAAISLATSRLNLKCQPAHAIALRQQHSAVQPGYHMNKQHWNSIYWEQEALSTELVRIWIDESYQLVVDSLPQRIRQQLVTQTR